MGGPAGAPRSGGWDTAVPKSSAAWEEVGPLLVWLGGGGGNRSGGAGAGDSPPGGQELPRILSM